MECVFKIIVVLGNVLRDDVGSGARRYHHRLETASPRLKRENDFADIAGDDRIDMILGRGALKRAHGFRGGGVPVVCDDLDLAAVDAAFGVDLVGSELGSLRIDAPATAWPRR